MALQVIKWTMILALASAAPLASAQAPTVGSASATAPKPVGSVGLWITDNDYPRDALHDLVAGSVKFDLVVGVDGVPVSCTITISSGSASLDQQTCARVQERARFLPARDAQGAPVIGTYSSQVRWALPDGPPVHAQSTSFRVSYDVDVNGMVHNCAMTPLAATIQVNPCRNIVRVTPYRDAQNNAIAQHVASTTVVEISDVK